MRIFDKNKLTLASHLLNNTACFFLISALLALAFYSAGIKYGFTENTQLLMLKIIFISGVFLFMMNGASVVLKIVLQVVNKNFKVPLSFAIYIVLAALAAALAIFSGAVIVLSGGNKL
jgi:hypothetical protein